MQVMIHRDRIIRLMNQCPGEIAVGDLETLTKVDDYLRRVCTGLNQLKAQAYDIGLEQ